MASPQPRKRARITRASRRAATFELLGDGTARTALPVDDARKSAVLATASGEFRCGGQNQASLEAIKRFLAACDDDGEVSSSPLSRADADVALRCCEAGATLELPSLVKLGVARLRANAPIFGIDRDGRVDVWNQCAARLTGFGGEEVAGKRLVEEYITDDYKARVQEVFTKALAGEETANFEFPLVTKGGVVLQILLNATTRRDDRGRVVGVVGIGQDITARMNQEQEYARLIDAANAPIFGIDVEGRVNVWNQCAIRLTGFDAGDVMGQHLVDDFITEDYKERVQDVFTKALNGEETANFEFPLVTKPGTRVEVLLNATTRRDEKNRVIGVVGIGQDITARINQEQEYARLIDAANAPIFGIDVEGSVNVWNQCAIRLTGFDAGDVMGKHLVNEFITDDYKASVQGVFTKALNGEETANFEFPLVTNRVETKTSAPHAIRFVCSMARRWTKASRTHRTSLAHWLSSTQVTKAGTRVQVLLNATTRRDEKNTVIGVVGIGQDITARMAQEQEYARLIDTANAPIFGIGVHGRVNVWNKSATNLTGFTSEDVMGRHLVNEFITEDYKERVQEVFRNALNGVETANFEFPLVTKMGTRVEVLLNATTRRDEQKHVVGVVGIGQDITARIAKEQEYSRLIDTANAPIFGIDLNGLVNVWNRNASKLTGFASEEVMGRNLVNEFITEDYKERVQDVFNKALNNEETANFEFPLVTKAGVRVEVLLNATTRRDEQNRISGVVGIGQDITARMNQEQEYARLIDAANAPIFGIDVEGSVNVWNQCAIRLTGFDAGDVMGKHLVNEFITDDYKASVQGVFTKALEGRETANFEFPLVTKAGTRVQVLLNATTRRDEKNRVIGVVGIGQDITARMAQEQEYSKLIDTANAPIFGIDLKGLVNVWNKNASDVTGFTSEDVMGRHLVNEFITEDHKERVQEVFTKALDGQEAANFEFPIVTKAGTRVEVLLNATTRRDESNHVIGVVGIGQDITARIAKEQEYSRLIDTANAPIFGIDLNGLVNVWNRNASKLTGFASEEVMGRNLVNEFITEDYKERVQDVFTKALNCEETANFEFPLVTKAGVRVEVLLNATTRRDEQNRISGVVGIGQDITARMNQEQEYARLIDAANAPIFGIDVEGSVNVWNQCAIRLTGFDAGDVMGKHLVNEFITDDYKASVQGVFTKALEGRETANFEFPLVTKAGTRVQVLLNATTRRDEKNRVIGVVGIGQDITARMAQEQEYARLIDTANAPIFGIGVHGRVNVWNKSATNLTGFTSEDVMGRHLVNEFITEDYKERVQEVFRNALNGVETANFEFPLVTKTGTRVEVLLNATTRRDESNHVIGVVGIGQDITARIAQEQEYSKLIDTANAPIFGVDRDGLVNVWNKNASDVTGFSTDETMGKHLVNDFITEDYKERVQEVFTKALEGDETANFEFPLVTKAGTRVEVLLNATTRRDAEGRASGVVGIGQDITARIKKEQEYARLIDTANAPIFGIDLKGLVNVWNKNASDVTGFTSEDVMGRHLVDDFITEDHKERVQDVFTKALEGDETANFEFPIVTKAGTRVEVLLNATTRRDEANHVIGVVGIGQDITARMAQEQEYARLIDTANAPIFGVDVNGLVNVWNKNASDVTGFTSEDVMGRHLVNEFITDDYKDSVQGVFTKALNGEETANFEFPLVTKPGTRVQVLLNATTRRDEQKHVVGVVGIGQDITARIAQEQEYARLIDTANAPIFGIDSNGLVNVWNRNASNLTGFSSEDVMGRHLVNEFITDDFKERVQNVFIKALAGVQTANFEFPLVTKAGVRVEVLLNATTRRDEHNRISGVVGIGQDITARIAQEQEYSRLIDTANAPIFGIDLEGLVNVWNKNASDVTGFTTEDVMGRHLVNEFITDDYKERVQAVFRNALNGVETANFEFPLVTKAGARLEVLLNATTRRDAQNRVTGVVGIGQDITARIAQEQEYSRLIDTANAPIFGIDRNGLVNVWNRNASKLMGFAGEEVMGRNLVKDFITDDYKERVQDVFTKALEGRETANFEFPLVTKAGVSVRVLLNATTRRDDQGKATGVVGIGQDITARIAQEQEYARLIDTANAPIFGIDLEGRVNVWNQCASHLMGFETDDGAHLVSRFITDDYKVSVQNVFTKALVGVETSNFEFPLVTKDGARVQILLNATTRRDEQNRVIGVVGIGQDITARIAQEQEYSRLIETANAPIFGIDRDGRVNVWNTCASNLTGFGVAEVKGRHLVDDFITPQYKSSVQDVFSKALSGVETANFEFPLVTKAGKSVEILLNATTRRDERDLIIGVVGIGQDITARVAQEQEYARLIDTANAPIFGVNVNGLINVWNKNAETVTEFSREDTKGKNLVRDFIREEHRDRVQEVFTKALNGDETANFEFPLVTKAGKSVEILLNATTRRDEQGNVIGVVGIGQDITARIAQEQEYSRLIDSANAPIFGVDMNGDVNVWNVCSANLTGFLASETLGNSLVDNFITPQYRPMVAEVISRALRGIETANFEFPLMNKTSTKLISILLNATTRRDETGKVVGVVGIGQDISESRAKQDAIMKQREAEAAQAAQATISAHVYHEIRNVVGAVLALAERVSETVELSLLAGSPFDAEEATKLAKRMKVEELRGALTSLGTDTQGTKPLLVERLVDARKTESSQRGQQMMQRLPDAVRKLTEHQRVVCQHAVNTLNDMLDVAKIENGTYLPKEDVVDLGALCARAAELQGPRLQHAVELIVDAPQPGSLVVLTDRVLLLQFMTNLLSNAAKFTSTGKVLIFCAALEHSSSSMADVVLAVADTGPGIAPAQQKRVLMAFTTGDAVPHEDLSDTAAASRSTGIGLRLADLIANVLSLHGGPEVEVDEEDTEMKDADALPRVPSATNLYEHTPQRRWWRALRTGIQLESPVCPDVKTTLGSRGGPGTLLWLATRMKRAPAGSVEDTMVEERPSDNTRVLKLRGKMRVLVVDDQRTMRQMVATLFQRLCQENAGLEIELDTAISGEHATRLTRVRRYHVVTMDQQLSESYCSAVSAAREKKRQDNELKTDTLSPRDGFALSLTFGPDRIQNAQKRLAYFEREIDGQAPEPGDGTMVGHEAIRAIRDLEVRQQRPPTVCFNLTGNILEADRRQYSANGSSGVLPKPTKLSDLKNALLDGVPTFLANGSCVQRGNGVFHAFGELQLADRRR